MYVRFSIVYALFLIKKILLNSKLSVLFSSKHLVKIGV